MKKDKTFDCVEMKSEIQAALARQFADLPEHEKQKRILEELAKGGDRLARKWRELTEVKSSPTQ